MHVCLSRNHMTVLLRNVLCFSNGSQPSQLNYLANLELTIPYSVNSRFPRDLTDNKASAMPGTISSVFVAF